MSNSDLADEHLTVARSLAVDGQDEANFYGTKFGVPNVSIHHVAVPVELADGTTAVTRADGVMLPAPLLPPGLAITGSTLLGPGCCTKTGVGYSTRCALPDGSPPQLTRYHPQVHETVYTLATQDARCTSDLPRFAAWCGIRF